MWPTVKSGNIVDIIAPSGRFPVEQLQDIHQFVESWGLVPRIPGNILGEHAFLANSDEVRLQHLKDALYSEDSRLIWCVRGGHGTTRIMPELLKLSPPKNKKLLVGFSDITTLHLWLNQIWQWPSLHGPMVRQVAMQESDVDDVQKLKDIFFHGVQHYSISNLQALNDAARQVEYLQGETLGTCLSLMAASLGTPWQVRASGKILVLEDINELPYRLDRLLVHLANAGVFAEAKAVVLGDFGGVRASLEIEGCEKVLTDIFLEWLPRQNIHVPVYRRLGIGHGERNISVPLGMMANIIKNDENYELKFNF